MSGLQATDDQPLVSIVIPTFNRKQTLGRAVASALNQTYPNIEIVISDNASTDGSLDAIGDLTSDPRVKVLRNDSNIGAVANWKTALEATSGDYVKIVWSDDWMESNSVAALMAPFVKDPSTGFSICPQVIHFGDRPPAVLRGSEGPISLRSFFISMSGIYSLPNSAGAAIIKRSDALWGVTCAYNNDFPQCARSAIGPDLLLLYGAFRRGEIGWYTPHTTVHFTAGADSITVTSDPGRLRTCYMMAAAYLIAECDSNRYGVAFPYLMTVRAAKKPWSDDANAEQISELRSRLTHNVTPWEWITGSALGIMGSALAGAVFARYVVSRMVRLVSRPRRGAGMTSQE